MSKSATKSGQSTLLKVVEPLKNLLRKAVHYRLYHHIK